MKRCALVVCLLGLLLASAFGQSNFLQAKIPFDFVAAGKAMPAGNYQFLESNRMILLKNLDTKKTVELGFLTRIAADNEAQGKARISYDVQGGKHFIEAIWPEHGDGYLLHAVKGEHTHEIVRAK